jgi:glycosyltransferase involved in cell wall biosynthesis
MRGVDIARRTAPDLAFVLLGDGGAREDLRSLVVELGLRDVVRFIDPVPQDRVPDFLRSATVGLAPWPPSWDMQANRPLKLTEYLCMGLPVVLTDVTPHRIVPADAPFAFWAGDGGPQAFADAILEAYAARDDLPALGRTAAAWAAPRLGWAEQFAVLEGAIEATMQPPVDRIPADPRR